MGSKIKFLKSLFTCVLLITIFLIGTKSFAQNKINSPTLVRVGISTKNFKSLIYNSVSLIATDEWSIYQKENGLRIATVQSCDVVTVSYLPDGIQLKVGNKVLASKLTGAFVFDCPQGLLGVANLYRGGYQALYHGTLEVIPKSNSTQFYLVNELDIQNYLRGVVPNEMPIRFGLEALKAQSIAARNYVLMPRTRVYNEFDVDDSVASQVYYGANTEKELSNKAVDETEGLVGLYDWKLILAQYCSTAGGYTENYENAFSDRKIFPAKPKDYLKGRPDMLTQGSLEKEEDAKAYYMSTPESYDMKSPYYRWKREFDAKELQDVLVKTLPQQSSAGFVKPEFKKGDDLGTLKEIKVNKRGVSGKIMELEIITDKGNWHVYKEIVIRRTFQKNNVSLPSANVIFDQTYDNNKNLTKVTAYGGGFGHGVGMSQFGAGFMGNTLHKTFDKILKRYYTGISISTVPVILSSSEGQKTVTVNFFAPYKKAVIVVDNKYQIKKFSANINNTNVEFELSTSLLPINRFSRIDISQYIKQGKNSVEFSFPAEEKNKGIRLYVELVGKDECEYSF